MKKQRTRHRMYLNVKIRLEDGIFKVYSFGFNSLISAIRFIDKLKANGIITNS